VAAQHRRPQAVQAAAQLRPARLRRSIRAHRIVGVGALDRVEGGRQVGDRAGERADVIERRGEQCGARAGDAPVGRLEAEDPQSAAGTRIDPFVSEPSVSGTRPAATAAAEPPDEPPGTREGSRGLRVGP
jgi:hypothetical protein